MNLTNFKCTLTMLGFKRSGYFIWNHPNLPSSIVVMKKNKARYLHHNMYTAIINAVTKDLENVNLV